MSQIIPLTEHFTQSSHCKNGEKAGKFYCVDNKWTPRLANGSACDADNACASGNCVDNKCSKSEKRLANGSACDADNACASGKCIDGKCIKSSSYSTPISALSDPLSAMRSKIWHGKK